MRVGTQRYVGAVATVVIYCFLLAMRLRDGTDWPILAASGAAILVGWRFAYHRHMFELTEDSPPDVVSEAQRKYWTLWAVIAAIGIVVANAFWLF